MTTEPNREHVEAVAEALLACRMIYTSAEREEIAERLLGDTHPHILDAMQDALVRAGRLTPDDRHEYGCPSCYHAPTTRHECVEVRYSRHVTDWTEDAS